MKYIISDVFNYEKHIAPDIGNKYARNMGWKVGPLSTIDLKNEDTFILDALFVENEYPQIEKIIAHNSENLFIISVIDPCFHCRELRHYKFINEMHRYDNVCIVSRYTPSEVLIEIMERYGRKRFFFLPNVFVDYNIEFKDFNKRQNKIIASGAIDKDVYPLRTMLLNRIKRSFFLKFKVSILRHPGYIDIIPGEYLHDKIGDKYVRYLSEFKYMFITPSRCDCELLKYSECAAAGCLPVGKACSSLPEQAKKNMVEIDFTRIGKSIKKIFSIPVDEVKAMAQNYRNIMIKERSRDILNHMLNEFVKNYKK
jgi:hypothetical protein